jgi:hypothetical protein
MQEEKTSFHERAVTMIVALMMVAIFLKVLFF